MTHWFDTMIIVFGLILLGCLTAVMITGTVLIVGAMIMGIREHLSSRTLQKGSQRNET